MSWPIAPDKPRRRKTIELPEGIVIPLHAELTTVQAAELLNVSRPYLTKRIDAGELPHHMVGTHRGLKLLDVLAYRDRLEARTNEALDAMTAEAEDLGLYGVPTSGQPRFGRGGGAFGRRPCSRKLPAATSTSWAVLSGDPSIHECRRSRAEPKPVARRQLHCALGVRRD